MIKKIKILFNCKLMGAHNWTSANEEGIQPTQEQIDNGIEGFWDYAKMYCKDCGEVSSLSKGWQNEASKR